MGRHASSRASTKTHTANRRRVSWPSCLSEVRRAALLDELSADPICHTFELGGTSAALGDVAFVRDEITVSFLLHDDLERVVWHCLLFSWLGAADPDQITYRWLREANLAKPFGYISPDVVSEIYRRVRVWVQERGLCAVFSGDSSLVLFRLQPSQDGLLSPSPAL